MKGNVKENGNESDVYEAIKSLSKVGMVTVSKNILNEIENVLDGLNVRYSTVETNGEITSDADVINIIMS